MTSEPILDDEGCPVELGDTVQIGADRYRVTEFGTRASVMLEPLNGGRMRQFPASLVLVVKRATTVPYGPEQTNIGRSIRDHRGRTFEIEDESLDGRYVVVLTGWGDSQIDLEERYPIFD